MLPCPMPNPEGTAISQRSLRNFPSLKIDGENENVWKFNFLHCQTLKYSKIQRNLWLIFPFSLFHISAFLILAVRIGNFISSSLMRERYAGKANFYSQRLMKALAEKTSRTLVFISFSSQSRESQ